MSIDKLMRVPCQTKAAVSINYTGFLLWLIM